MSDDKSCLNCVHYLSGEAERKQQSLLGKPVPLSLCVERGMVISTNLMRTLDQVKRAEQVAETCSKYTPVSQPQFRDQFPSHNKFSGFKIGPGSSELPDAPKTGPVKTCKGCHFFIDGKIMAEKHNIPVGACAKFGRAIPESRADRQAQNCNDAVRFSCPDKTEPMDFKKKLADNLIIDPLLKHYLFPEDVDAVSDADRVDPTVDPLDHTSDRPVTPRQSALGIRAWRRITSGNRELFMPIFEPSFFSDDERAKIPRPGDDEHPDQYNDHMNLTFKVAALWFKLDETPALHGKAGTGKTEFFRYMAYLMQLPFERISITRSTQIDDLAGKMHFENNETKFKPGRIPQAWSKPNVVVLDEPNTGAPEVWQYIRPLTDNSKVLVNDLNEGETVTRNRFTYLGMAMNPAWDPRNVGAEVIGDADGSRLMHIFVDLPTEDVERAIISERCKADEYDIPESTLDVIMLAAKMIRELSDADELPITWGIRNQIKVARATAWFSLQQAYKLAVLDYLEPQVGEVVSGLIDEAETQSIKNKAGIKVTKNSNNNY